MNKPLAILLVLSLLPVSVLADNEKLPRTITVSGQGKSAAPPDLASIQTGVVTTGDTAKDALAANSSAMAAVIKVLKAKNIAERDIQTFGFSVHPQYRRVPGPRGTQQQSNKIEGYRVTNNVRVRVRNLPRLGEILDALVQAGSNNLSGVQFSIADSSGILDEARKNAMDDARGRAELYAQAAGVKLGRVVSISEQALQPPRPMMMGRMAMAESASVPIATGEHEVSARVNVMYEITE